MDIKKAEDIIDKMYQDKMSIRERQTEEGLEIEIPKNVTFTELEEASVILLRNNLILKRKNEEKDRQITALVKYIDSNNCVTSNSCEFQDDFKIEKCIDEGNCKECIEKYFEEQTKN